MSLPGFDDKLTWMVRLPRKLASALIDRANERGENIDQFLIDTLVRGCPGRPVDPSEWRIPGYETLTPNTIDATGWAEAAFDNAPRPAGLVSSRVGWFEVNDLDALKRFEMNGAEVKYF